MKIKTFTILFLLAIFIPTIGLAQNPFTDRAKQIEDEIGMKNLDTYQQAAEETARIAAEEEKNRQEAAAPKGSGIMDWLGSNVVLPFENYVRIPSWNYLKNSGITVKDWISSKIDKISSDETVPAVKNPVISIFSEITGWFSDLSFSSLKKNGFIPLTEERKLRAERIKNLSTPPQPLIPGASKSELPLGLSEEGFTVPGSSLVAPLSGKVPSEALLKCRADIFISCNTCPSASNPENFGKQSGIKESCAQCITDNYDRLQICIINSKFPITKPVDDVKKPIEDDKNPSDDTGGAVIE